MRVLITGGNGFVGLNLAEALLARGDEAVLFDLREPPPVFTRSVERRGYAGRLNALTGDVCQPRDVARAFAVGGITHVFQGAAITAGAARERDEPQRIFDVNLGGTVSVLAGARDAGVQRVLYPSSVAVYGHSLFDRPLVTEDDPAVPEGLYGVSKYAGERTALRLGTLWGLDVVAGRIGNAFGPWECETGLRDLVTPLAQIAACAARGHEAVLPRAKLQRDLIYSRDLAAALLALLEAPTGAARVVNLSVMDDWNDFYRRWCRALEPAMPGFRWQVAQHGLPANIDYYDLRARGRLDTTRLATQLGFTPAFTPDQAISDYARWLQSHADYFAEAA
jgi:nucleoside-diphosphate-sugar epimerase